jgi:hypothetical protein
MREKQLLPSDRDRGGLITIQKEDTRITKALKLKQLLSHFYSILTNSTPPTCQGNEKDNDHYEQANNMTEQQLKAGVHDGSILSAVANTRATSSIRTTKDKRRNAFIPTGQQSTKSFHMPNGTVEAAMDVDELHHKVCHPAKDIHILPRIEGDLLLSMEKFADANYKAIFDKDKLNIYNANNTKVTLSPSTILCGWQCTDTNFWSVPLVPYLTNNNTETVLCNQPPTEFLPQCPPQLDAIYNVCELKTQPELVRYHHAASRFPTKPTWLKAIKNKQFAL